MKKINLILVMAIACFAMSITAMAQSNPKNILFIFDASGSMWGKLGNSTKIEVAKQTMGTLVQKLNSNTKAGLIAYGHRNSECSDIETLQPVAALDKTKFTATVRALNPKGKTPIAKSILHAITLIKAMNEAVTVILVTDGLETCEGIACDIIRKAKAEGIKITLHVVGFGIAEKDLSSLECAAQAGGGQYFPANSAEELATALEQSVKEVPKGDAFLSIKTTLDSKLKDAYIKVYKKGNPKDGFAGRTYESAATNPRILQLPAGTYDVEIRPVDIDGYATIKFSDLVIPAGDTTKRDIEFKQGIIETKITRNDALSDATVQVFLTGTKTSVANYRTYAKAETNPAVLKVPPGIYDIVITSAEMNGSVEKKFIRQTVVAGEKIALPHNFESGELLIGAKNAQGYVDATVVIHDLKTKKDIASGRTYQAAGSNPKKFILVPGNYRVDLMPVKPSGLAKKSITAEVTVNSKVEKIAEW
ncbi:MAG: VWA domain-containing protein [Chitinophagaceae bacterium]|nr:VWA domain-containing protein [Chitinophagaceae bacterium]